jgi:hypothetical protein
MAGGGSSSCCHEARNRRAATAAGQGKKARARPPVVAVGSGGGGERDGCRVASPTCAPLPPHHHRTQPAHPSRTFMHVGGKTMTPRNSHMDGAPFNPCPSNTPPPRIHRFA